MSNPPSSQFRASNTRFFGDAYREGPMESLVVVLG